MTVTSSKCNFIWTLPQNFILEWTAGVLKSEHLVYGPLQGWLHLSAHCPGCRVPGSIIPLGMSLSHPALSLQALGLPWASWGSNYSVIHCHHCTPQVLLELCTPSHWALCCLSPWALGLLWFIWAFPLDFCYFLFHSFSPTVVRGNKGTPCLKV